VRFRLANPADAAAVAQLHAESWRRHYRGAYSDAFLDGDVVADRLEVWTQRLQAPDPRRCTILAEEGRLVGFANTFFDHDPTWGALLARPEATGLYLWVLEQNRDAQAFYEACGAKCVDRHPVEPPGAIASRLNGSPLKLRYVWPPEALLGRP
jgi:hypothetical protein